MRPLGELKLIASGRWQFRVRRRGTGTIAEDTEGWLTQHPSQPPFPCLSSVEAKKLKKKNSYLPDSSAAEGSKYTVLANDIIRNLLGISGKGFATFLLPGTQMWLMTSGAATAILGSWRKTKNWKKIWPNAVEHLNQLLTSGPLSVNN